MESRETTREAQVSHRTTDLFVRSRKVRQKHEFLNISIDFCFLNYDFFERDMTFLYDSVIHEKPVVKPHVSKYDLSAIRQQQQQENGENNVNSTNNEIADSLIPEEYKIVVNHGVAPLKVDKK